MGGLSLSMASAAPRSSIPASSNWTTPSVSGDRVASRRKYSMTSAPCATGSTTVTDGKAASPSPEDRISASFETRTSSPW